MLHSSQTGSEDFSKAGPMAPSVHGVEELLSATCVTRIWWPECSLGAHAALGPVWHHGHPKDNLHFQSTTPHHTIPPHHTTPHHTTPRHTTPYRTADTRCVLISFGPPLGRVVHIEYVLLSQPALLVWWYGSRPLG